MNILIKHSSILAVMVFLFICGYNRTFARDNVSVARAVGMGGAYTALSRGIDAARWNPANLGLKNNPKFSLNFISVGIRFANTSFSRNDYNLYSGAFLDQNDISAILDKVSDSGLRVDASGEIRALSCSYRQFAFVLTGEGLASGLIAKDYLDLILNGNDFDREYSFNSTQAVGYVISKAIIATGFPIRNPYVNEFTIGMSLKYLRGFAFGSLDESNGSFITWRNGIDAEGRVIGRYAKGGTGFGIDLGFAAVFKPTWTCGITIKNIGTSIRWSQHVREEEIFYLARLVTVESADEDTLFDYENISRELLSFRSSLPKQLRIGVAHESTLWNMTFDLLIEWRQRRHLSPWPRYALGAEYLKFQKFPLRCGIAVGGVRGISPSIGIGFRLKKFKFDLGFSYQRAVLPFTAKGVTIALATGFEF